MPCANGATRLARPGAAGAKVAPANATWEVACRASQAVGGVGIADDFPRVSWYAHRRARRLADGPDEVHKMTIARRELRRHDPDFRM